MSEYKVLTLTFEGHRQVLDYGELLPDDTASLVALHIAPSFDGRLTLNLHTQGGAEIRHDVVKITPEGDPADLVEVSLIGFTRSFKAKRHPERFTIRVGAAWERDYLVTL